MCLGTFRKRLLLSVSQSTVPCRQPKHTFVGDCVGWMCLFAWRHVGQYITQGSPQDEISASGKFNEVTCTGPQAGERHHVPCVPCPRRHVPGVSHHVSASSDAMSHCSVTLLLVPRPSRYAIWTTNNTKAVKALNI